jgi:hypothetical protein
MPRRDLVPSKLVFFQKGSWNSVTPRTLRDIVSTPFLTRKNFFMDTLSNLINGFQMALSLQNIYLCFIGCLWGSMVGILPGIGPSGIHFYPGHLDLMQPGRSLCLRVSIMVHGGSTTSILMNPRRIHFGCPCLDGQ